MSWIKEKVAFLDHQKLCTDDLQELGKVEILVLWAVELSEPDLLPQLKHLKVLDLRGGKVSDVEQVGECRQIHRLALSWNRSLESLAFLSVLKQLEGLSFYALPKVRDLAPLAELPNLRRLDLGSMRSVTSFRPILDCPNLEMLHLSNKMGIARDQIELLREHPALKMADWFSPDEPRWTFDAMEWLGLPPSPLARIEDEKWLT